MECRNVIQREEERAPTDSVETEVAREGGSPAHFLPRTHWLFSNKGKSLIPAYDFIVQQRLKVVRKNVGWTWTPSWLQSSLSLASPWFWAFPNFILTLSDYLLSFLVLVLLLCMQFRNPDTKWANCHFGPKNYTWLIFQFLIFFINN